MALERRFQKVFVGNQAWEDTIAILRGLKERYEIHHHVQITDPAIVAAATLSHRYISDRQLPDKAMTIDEAASSIRMEIDSNHSRWIADRRIINSNWNNRRYKKKMTMPAAKRSGMLEKN